jgi:hypothetical protein
MHQLILINNSQADHLHKQTPFVPFQYQGHCVKEMYWYGIFKGPH